MKRSLGTAINRGRLSVLAAFVLAAGMLAVVVAAPASARAAAVFPVRARRERPRAL